MGLQCRFVSGFSGLGFLSCLEHLRLQALCLQQGLPELLVPLSQRPLLVRSAPLQLLIPLALML